MISALRAENIMNVGRTLTTLTTSASGWAGAEFARAWAGHIARAIARPFPGKNTDVFSVSVDVSEED